MKVCLALRGSGSSSCVSGVNRELERSIRSDEMNGVCTCSNTQIIYPEDYADAKAAMASIPPRPFLPIQPCPTIAHFPPLPSPPRQTIHAAYTLTTHLVPAAFPRSIPDIPLPEIPPHSAPNRQAQITLLTTELVEMRARFAQGELRGGHSRKPLWNCVNRQVRTDKRHVTRPGLTLFLAHANGFPKEACASTYVFAQVLTSYFRYGRPCCEGFSIRQLRSWSMKCGPGKLSTMATRPS